jgi:hypothetical protein
MLMGSFVTSMLSWTSAVVAAAILGIAPATAQQPNLLKVVNSCKATIWIEQQNLPGAPAVQAIPAGKSYTYRIPLSGPQSTRFWPKTGCNASGSACAIGQSSPPCPPQGCAPPLDSKLEVSWGCLSSSGCGVGADTWFNLSQVDGFTLPYAVAVQNGHPGPACRNAACPAINYTTQCPAHVDLSTEGAFPQLKNQNLRALDPTTHRPIGCFSNCGKLTYARSFGGLGLPPSDPRAGFYCCATINGTNPIPPLDPGTAPGCRAGPAPSSTYVRFIDKACADQVYGYAYDDAHGTKTCTGRTTLVFTICPGAGASGPAPRMGLASPVPPLRMPAAWPVSHAAASARPR